MCGICGIYSFNAKDLRPKKDLLKRMTAALIHRGPDAEGYVIDKKVLLGMRRLSIIDLQTGSQPVYSEDKKVTAVFNGEIFNFRELREELRAKGHFFNSESDSEVIPHLYEEYRENFIDRLNGQFAIAVFDKRDNSILLIRDRLGIKPLYFYRDGENLIFGSELKAILPCLTRRPEIDPGSVWEYLSFACIPQDKSIYKNIRKLLPGFYLKADKSGLKTVQYWEIKGEGLKNITEDEVHHELLSLLKSSVKKRLISDVPLGVFLSGGIDSSAITALYREVSDDKLMTFSVGFREKSYNELEDAARIAEYFKTDHNFIVIDPDARETIDKLPALFDEPYADSSAVNVYHISRFSRERITVALSGEGGDEIFGGYMTYTADQIANIYRYFYKVLPTSHSILKKLVELLPSSEKKVSLDYKLKRFLKGVDALPEISHFKWKEIFDLEMKRGVLNQDYFTANLEQFNNSDPYTTISKYFNNYTGEDDFINRMLYLDLKTYLPDDLLVKADRTSMANSMEVRVPLLDHEIVEFMASIPSSLKIKFFNRKIILKKALKGILPDFTFKKRKSGFSVPLNSWFRNELREPLNDLIFLPGHKIDFINYDFVKSMINSHVAGKADYSRQLWSILMLVLWYEKIYTFGGDNVKV